MRRFRLLLLSLLVAIPLSAKETEQRLAIERGGIVVATEATLGAITEPAPRVRAMLEHAYTLDWLESYVDPAVRSAFSRAYGDRLADVLPVKGALYGKPVPSGPYTLVPVRVPDGTYLTLCMRDGLLVGLSIDS